MRKIYTLLVLATLMISCQRNRLDILPEDKGKTKTDKMTVNQAQSSIGVQSFFDGTTSLRSNAHIVLKDLAKQVAEKFDPTQFSNPRALNKKNVTDYNGWFAFDNWYIPGLNWNYAYSRFATTEIHP